jgi:hypothetical protein
MRCLNRLVLFFLFTTALSGVVASAQMPSAAVPDDDEDLRRAVRELALRVAVLEEELHMDRTSLDFAYRSLFDAGCKLLILIAGISLKFSFDQGNI